MPRFHWERNNNHGGWVFLCHEDACVRVPVSVIPSGVPDVLAPQRENARLTRANPARGRAIAQAKAPQSTNQRHARDVPTPPPPPGDAGCASRYNNPSAAEKQHLRFSGPATQKIATNKGGGGECKHFSLFHHHRGLLHQNTDYY